ncbi:MAG: response regulator transcription factor [Verrucomicrobiota bacterium]
MNPKILVAEDESDMLKLISLNLKSAGFEVIGAEDGQSALELARFKMPALIILDLMLPLLSGLEVCKLLKADPATAAIPIIMLTAKAEEIDRILGLELGADDYVTKPFSPRELVLRVKSVLRRNQKPGETSGALRAGSIEIDPERYEVRARGKVVDLTPTEFKLLTLLAERRGRVQTRERLLDEVWGYASAVDTRTVDTHVARLREKLGKAGEVIETIRGIGYRILEE